jgi:hypothetical protein
MSPFLLRILTRFSEAKFAVVQSVQAVVCRRSVRHFRQK